MLRDGHRYHLAAIVLVIHVVKRENPHNFAEGSKINDSSSKPLGHPSDIGLGDLSDPRECMTVQLAYRIKLATRVSPIILENKGQRR